MSRYHLSIAWNARNALAAGAAGVLLDREQCEAINRLDTDAAGCLGLLVEFAVPGYGRLTARAGRYLAEVVGAVPAEAWKAGPVRIEHDGWEHRAGRPAFKNISIPSTASAASDRRSA